MTVDEAVPFFEWSENIRKSKKQFKMVVQYITLITKHHTLCEQAQRIKLAGELFLKDTGNTFYIDEP
jgi:excinuclease UvrABC ATPase subunit